MDHGSLIQKLKQHQGAWMAGTGILTCVIGLTLGLKVGARYLSATDIVHAYGGLFGSIQEKVDDLRRVDEENEKLKLENAHLRLVLESENYERYAGTAEKITKAYEWKLTSETGSKTGRTLASIDYKIPTNLMPSQLFVLGVNYFKARDDEKAAVILTFLTGMDGDDTYKTPSDYMMTGIAWYRLENFELANFYFDRVMQAKGEKLSELHAQAKLWKGLAAERQGQHVVAQYWLHEVMDQNPHSVEAQWINTTRQGVEREPAESHEN